MKTTYFNEIMNLLNGENGKQYFEETLQYFEETLQYEAFIIMHFTAKQLKQLGDKMKEWGYPIKVNLNSNKKLIESPNGLGIYID